MPNLVIDGQTIDDVRPGVQQRGERTGGRVRMFSGRVRSTVRTTGRVWSFQTTEQTDAVGQGIEALAYSAKGVVDVYGGAVGYDSTAPLYAVIEPGETQYVNDSGAFVRVVNFRVIEARPLETPLRYVPGFGNLTHSRADGSLIATYTDDDGRIQTVTANGELRDDHYTADGDRATLLELSRTNLVTWSDALSNWSTSGTPPPAVDASVSAGDLDLALLEDDSAAAARYYHTAPSFTGNGAKSIAVAIKEGTAAAPVVQLWDSTDSASRLIVVFSFSGGVPSAAVSTGSQIGSAEAKANGIYVFRFKTTAVTAGNTHALRAVPAGFTASATGTVYMGGFMAVDAEFCGSPIKTTGSTVTRAVDIASHIMPAAIVDPSTPWTWYGRWVAGMDGDGGETFPRVWQIGDGSPAATEKVQLTHSSGTLGLYHGNGSTQESATLTSGITKGDDCEAVVTWAGDGTATLYLWVGGSFVDSATLSGITPASAWNPDGNGDVRVYYNSRDGGSNAGAMGLRDSKFAYRGGRVPIQASTNAQLLAMMRAL